MDIINLDSIGLDETKCACGADGAMKDFEGLTIVFCDSCYVLVDSYNQKPEVQELTQLVAADNKDAFTIAMPEVNKQQQIVSLINRKMFLLIAAFNYIKGQKAASSDVRGEFGSHAMAHLFKPENDFLNNISDSIKHLVNNYNDLTEDNLIKSVKSLITINDNQPDIPDLMYMNKKTFKYINNGIRGLAKIVNMV